MATATKEGPWITAVRVVRIDCSKCGTVKTSSHSLNDREIHELVKQHAIEFHGGIDRG